MREFRKKQKKLKKIMNTLVVVTAIFLFVFIGVQPMLPDLVGQVGTMIIGYANDVLILVCLVVLFIYFSRYGKSDKFLESVENELSDTGYYFTARKQSNIDDYSNAVKNTLIDSRFVVEDNVEIDDFTFDTRGMKKKEFFYIIKDEIIDKNDILAYQQSAIYDITSVSIRRKGNGVLLFVCDKADDSAIALSKMITPLGKKEQIKLANVIVELSTGRCYFLGNNPTKCQQMIVNFAMGCDIPLDSKYIGSERLAFQDELEEHMKSFNIKDFKNGTFYAH